jgi:hypothetical protein
MLAALMILFIQCGYGNGDHDSPLYPQPVCEDLCNRFMNSCEGYKGTECVDACLGNADTHENYIRAKDVLDCTSQHLPIGGDPTKCAVTVQCYCSRWEDHMYMEIDGSPQCVYLVNMCPPDRPVRCQDDLCHECCEDADCTDGVCVDYICSTG